MEPGKMAIRVAGLGQTVPFHSFLKIADSMLGLLKGVEGAITGGKDDGIDWQIEAVSMASPLSLVIGAHGGSSQVADDVITGCLKDMRLLDTGPNVPRYLDENLMARAKAMVAELNGNVSMIELDGGGVFVVPTQRISAHIDEITPPYKARASLEGILQSVNAHATKVLKVYDALTGKGVRCVFPDDLKEEVKEDLYERVIVSGVMTYHRDGRPLEMAVSEISRVPGSPTQFFEGPPLNITDGVDPADYIERLREDE